MYFDDCQEPAELQRAIGEFMKIQTGIRVSLAGKGSVAAPLIDEHTDQTLREGVAEAYATARKLRKTYQAFPNVPGPSVVPLESLMRLSEWCDRAKRQMPEKPAETKKILGPTSNITTEDIDKLLELFRQLENLLNPELPPRDGQLWEKALEQSKKELADELKKRQSGFTLRPSGNNPKRESIKAIHPKKEEQAERIIRQMAEKKYRLWDSKYNQSLSQVEEKIVELVKRIDHTLYSMKEPLLAFDRTQGTLLQANFRKIRDDFTINDIRQFQDQDMVKKSIDALQAIRLKVERQHKPATQKPAETGLNEIVEVKPGAFGITVNIKEIARRIWKRFCSRRI